MLVNLVNEASGEVLARAPAKSDVSIWDTHYTSPRKAFGVYREAICEVYMPWSPEWKGDAEFHARVEALTVGEGVVSRIRCSSHTTGRTMADVGKSEVDSLYVGYFLSGKHELDKGGRRSVAKPGDVLVCDSEEPLRVMMSAEPQDLVVLRVPKSELGAEAQGGLFANCLLDKKRTPLSNCLALIGQRLISGSREELAALYRACVYLLPLEAGVFDKGEDGGLGSQKGQHLLRQILTHIDANVANTDLSPQEIAARFGISVRYVHKLFMASGTTFCTYVTEKRLDYVRRDLSLRPGRDQLPISAVAFRWGFNDLSSFNRAFKVRFGCTPSQLRTRLG